MLGIGGAAVEQIGEIVAGGFRQMADADADQAEPGRADLVASRSRPAAKMRAASWVGWPSERARVRILKSALLSFSVTVEPASALAFSRADTFSVSPHSCCSSGRNR